MSVLLSLDESFDGGDLVLLHGGFFLLLSLPHRLQVLLVFLGGFREGFITSERLQRDGFEFHFLCKERNETRLAYVGTS